MEDKIKNIIKEYKSLPNKDLEYGLEKLSEDFEDTKQMILKLTHYLDSLEHSYNNILKEYNNRVKR